MATTNYLLTQTQNSNGKSQIILRTYVRHDYRIRIQSGIWVSPKRWGKKNGITIPTIPGEEQEMLLQKKELLKRLTAYIEDEINKVEDKNAIDKIWGEKKVRTFYKPTKAPKEREKSFFDVIDTYLSSHKLSEQRLKNFKVLTRCLHRFELFKKKDGSRVFSLTLANLSPELLRQIEDFLTDEKAIFLRYPEIYEQFPYSAKIAVKTPKRKRPPILDDEGNEVPKGMPKPRGQNTVADLLTRFRAFILWAIDNGYTTNNPFKHFSIGEIVYGTPIYISNEERNKLLETDLSDDKEVETQRDIFVFQCLVGCRVSDLNRLTKANVVDGCVEYIPQKTKMEHANTVRVPLNQKALDILERYKDLEDALLPRFSHFSYNKKIKEILKYVGIDRMVRVLDPKTREDVARPLYEVATTHMARKTFIGNLYKQVKDPNLIASMSGHSEGSRAFVRYRKIDDDMKKELVNLLD